MSAKAPPALDAAEDDSEGDSDLEWLLGGGAAKYDAGGLSDAVPCVCLCAWR